MNIHLNTNYWLKKKHSKKEVKKYPLRVIPLGLSCSFIPLGSHCCCHFPHREELLSFCEAVSIPPTAVGFSPCLASSAQINWDLTQNSGI